MTDERNPCVPPSLSSTPNPAVRRFRRGSAVIVAGSVAASAVGLIAGTATAARAPHAKVVPLVVYSAQGYDKLVTSTFSKKFHIPVQLDDNSTGPLLTQIEASKNNPKWGLLWVDGATAFASLDQQGLLLRNWEPNVTWNAVGTASLPKDKSYTPSGTTLVAAVVYDSTKVKSPPTSWQQLLTPAWKGKVGMDDPSQSGPTYPLIAGMMNYFGGVAKGESFFSKLKANGLVINPTNGPTLAALASGQIELALVQSSAAVGATFTDKKLKVIYLKPATLLPSVMGIDSKAPAAEQAEAKMFEQYVLSSAGQKEMQFGDPTGDSLYYPVLQSVAPRKALPALPPASVLQSIDPYKWGSLENSVNSWFTANVVQ
ncbi:MAG: extracellular solute-binding protein family 1 [Acidimicrobiaceae bacterium]|nr:extracellular solute-binding protein family 1 [Acidimicrobiaceae bacterium]